MKNSYVKTIVLVAIIIGGVMAFWFGLRVGLGTEYPLLTVASGSMIPTLNVGDLILVQGVLNYTELRASPKPEGEIIVFRSPRTAGELIVHRAVDKEFHNGFWYFATQGDAASGGPDRWSPYAVPDEDVWNGMISERLLIGKVVGKVPWVGYVPLYIRTREGIIVIIVLFLLVILAEYIPVLLKKRPEQR